MTNGSDTVFYNGAWSHGISINIVAVPRQVISTYATGAIEGLEFATEIGLCEHGDRAGLASLDGCPDFSGSGESDTEEDGGDSGEELHACE